MIALIIKGRALDKLSEKKYGSVKTQIGESNKKDCIEQSLKSNSLKKVHPILQDKLKIDEIENPVFLIDTSPI